MNLDRLLDKAKWSKLSDQELAQVVHRIRNHQSDKVQTLYTLLHILGRSEAIEHHALMETFLYYPEEPMITRIALKSLCNDFGLTKNYLDLLKKFILGVDWDEEDDVRLIAISIAGTYINETGDTTLLPLLLAIYENENEDNSFRNVAYEALARATGIKSIDLPSARKVKVLERARQMLISS